jgi:hypothetical protein
MCEEARATAAGNPGDARGARGLTGARRPRRARAPGRALLRQGAGLVRLGRKEWSGAERKAAEEEGKEGKEGRSEGDEGEQGAEGGKEKEGGGRRRRREGGSAKGAAEADDRRERQLTSEDLHGREPAPHAKARDGRGSTADQLTAQCYASCHGLRRGRNRTLGAPRGQLTRTVRQAAAAPNGETEAP